MNEHEFISQMSSRFLGKFRQNELLASMTTFKIGGPARFLLKAGTPDDIVQGVLVARKAGLRVFLLGGGSNVLIGDRGFDGLVIKNTARAFGVAGIRGSRGKSVKKDVFIKAQSGAITNQIVRFSIDEGLAGLEMHLGLPGSIGGAVAMNSKWMHPVGFVGDALYQATILTASGEVRIVPRGYFNFSYGTSTVIQTGDMILDVTFKLTQSTREILWKTATESIQYRRKTQPQGVFTAGCIFKNIPLSDAIAHAVPDTSTSAGFLIDKAGVKGYAIGDAVVSPIHANFIVNSRHAHAVDVLKLIETVKNSVHTAFRVMLKEEIIKIGEF